MADYLGQYSIEALLLIAAILLVCVWYYRHQSALALTHPQDFERLQQGWLWQLDEQFRFNYSAVHHLLAAPASLLGAEVWSILPAHQHQLFRQACQQASFDEPILLHHSWLGVDGQVIFAETRFLVRLHPKTRARYYSGLSRMLSSSDGLALAGTSAAWFSSKSIGIAVISPQGQILQVNECWSQMLGFSLVGRTEPLFVRDITHPDDLTESEQKLAQMLSGQIEHFHQEKRYLDQLGRVCWVDLFVSPVFNVKQQIDCFISVLIDINPRKQVEQRLSLLSNAVEQTSSAVCITRPDGIIEYVNPGFCLTSGYVKDEVLGKPLLLLRSTESGGTSYQQVIEQLLSGRNWYGEFRNRRKNGEAYWSLENISPVLDEQERVSHFVHVSDDVTEQRQVQLKLDRLAFYDALTGLENRKLFRERLEYALNRRLPSQQLALLFLDLDQFKRINDTQGHDVGDQLLQQVAHRLKSCIRDSDSLARLGGDEFTILLTDVNSLADVELVAQKVLDTLAPAFMFSGQEIRIGASIGITMVPDDGSEASLLSKNADLAMYHAKEAGRNSYQFYHEDMNVRAVKRLLLETELRQAMDNQHFVLYFQPQIDFRSMKVIGMEALIRWIHPEKGLIPPDQFIPMAEETGLIVPLGVWVLQESCALAKRLSIDHHIELTVAVNLSARQFRDPSLVAIVAKTLDESGLPARQLELEITESMLMEDINLAIEILQNLKSLGVSLSVDDFGTGYSSLAYLKRLPIDSIKVDKSFVRDIPRDKSDMEITAAVIAMAHKLELKVVAEGVENAEQVEFLQHNNCDFGQGFHYSRPVPEEQLMNKLAELGLTSDLTSPIKPPPADD